jgi:2-polyprenyl-3-methyl-5-hydroxy-6-metoxy-1,4-benzoquinol methylase
VDTLDPLRYDTEIDEHSESSHGVMLRMIGRDTRVLEIGCSTGAMTKVLVGHGCSVVGIEFEPAAAEKAGEFAERVIVGDVETLDLGAELGDDRFDVVVFGDVLEHLRDPVSVVRKSSRVLADDGCVVMSVPNVAHGDVRLALLKGEFRYRPIGLLDATHLRFFTRDSLEELLHDSGFVPVAMHRLELGLFDSELELDRGDFDPELVAQIEAEPESSTYQFVVKAVPGTADGPLSVLHDRAEQFRFEARQLRRRVDELQQLVSDLGREVDLLRIETAVLGIERDDFHHELANVKSQRDDFRAELEAVRASLLYRAVGSLRPVYRRIKPLPPT